MVHMTESVAGFLAPSDRDTQPSATFLTDRRKDIYFLTTAAPPVPSQTPETRRPIRPSNQTASPTFLLLCTEYLCRHTHQ